MTWPSDWCRCGCSPALGGDWVRAVPGGALVCGRKEGVARKAILVVALGDPSTPVGAVTWAGLISLAKGWDLPGVPQKTHVLCAATGPPALHSLYAAPPVPPENIGATWILGPLHGTTLMRGQAGGPGGRHATLLEAPAAPPNELGDLDFRALEVRIREVLNAIETG